MGDGSPVNTNKALQASYLQSQGMTVQGEGGREALPGNSVSLADIMAEIKEARTSTDNKLDKIKEEILADRTKLHIFEKSAVEGYQRNRKDIENLSKTVSAINASPQARVNEIIDNEETSEKLI